ncbi:MAG TPA: isochorismatase family protein [Usitatibacter sp.]|nr:isochorismatase family protein [Usitatibacter sp.]
MGQRLAWRQSLLRRGEDVAKSGVQAPVSCAPRLYLVRGLFDRAPLRAEAGANAMPLQLQEQRRPHGYRSLDHRHPERLLPGRRHGELPNSFRETELLAHLRGNDISRLVIAGMMTHMCIDTTTRAAADLGFACLLAQDACATRALTFNGVQVPAQGVQAAYLAGLNGAFAKVQAADELIRQA